jgi:hypothetical protein
VSDAGCGSEFSGYAATAFWREEFKTLCFDSLIFKTCSSTDAQRLFKSFLTRNELVDSQKRVIFAG